MVIFSFHTDDRMSSSWLEIVKNPDKSLSSWQKLTNGIQSVADFWCFHSELSFRFSFGNCRATSMVFMYWEYVWFIKKKTESSFQVKELANISKKYQKVPWHMRSKCHLDKMKCLSRSQCSGSFKSLTDIWCSHCESFLRNGVWEYL